MMGHHPEGALFFKTLIHLSWVFYWGHVIRTLRVKQKELKTEASEEVL